MPILRYFALLLCTCCFVSGLKAQFTPVGQWQSHFSYQSANSVAFTGDKIFAGQANLFSYSLIDHEYSRYSKVNGLHDVNIRLLRYDSESGYLIIVYENSNIDLMKGNDFINIPDIRNANMTGSKRINSVYFENQLMYLCTDFGIVVLNPTRAEIKETYILQQNTEILNIYSLSTYNGQFYASTSKGMYTADMNNVNLQNFGSWTLFDSRIMPFVLNHNNQLFAASTDSLYQYKSGNLLAVYAAGSTITNISKGIQDLYICERNDKRRCIMILDNQGIPIDSVFSVNANDVCEVNNHEIWEADQWEGLIRLENRKNKSQMIPQGAFGNSFYNLSQAGEDIYVSSGGESAWEPLLNSAGISKYHTGDWTWYTRFNGFPAMDSVIDITDVAIDSRNQYLYAGSFGGGLLEIKPDNSTTVYKDNGFLQSQIGNPGANIIMDLAFDSHNNLWMTNYGAPTQLAVKKADNSWQSFALPFAGGGKYVSKMAIDNEDQKWVIAARGYGVMVLNDNQTIDNKNDDVSRLLTTGAGNGNLPNNEVLSIAKDRNGKIWIGTTDGIGIVNCPESVLTNAGCDAELKIVKYDLNAGLLFQRESVNAIAVDGANNKWIGTNNGVWLITDDAEKILHRFTKDNSPLPSNEINSIVIQPYSGEVFIATSAGLVSYRGEATEPNNTNNDLFIFPNPVPSGYSGSIAIKGLVENADVRITDAAGQLVYRTKAQGGQAVWNGLNYLGKRPRSGVMYVFVTNIDGTESRSGKFIFNE